MSTHRRSLLVAAAALATMCLSAGCGGGDEAFVPENVSQSRFDSRQFGDPAAGKNKWFPLEPGYQSVREGGVNRGDRRLSHRRVFTVTDVYKEIDGVRTVVVLDQDFDGGEIAEQALDYLAEDKQGNVWYFGSYTETYEGGQFVNAADAWLAGVDGSEPGLLMQANPKPGTPAYYQHNTPGLESPVAQVVKAGQSKCVPFKCYKNVLVVQEDGSENKYYAPGVGGILTEPRSGGDSGEGEVERLINLTQLTPRGLAELSGEALKIDNHAREVAQDVFGDAAPAKRTL
jgi:hypothetical protein